MMLQHWIHLYHIPACMEWTESDTILFQTICPILEKSTTKWCCKALLLFRSAFQTDGKYKQNNHFLLYDIPSTHKSHVSYPLLNFLHISQYFSLKYAPTISCHTTKYLALNRRQIIIVCSAPLKNSMDSENAKMRVREGVTLLYLIFPFFEQHSSLTTYFAADRTWSP